MVKFMQQVFKLFQHFNGKIPLLYGLNQHQHDDHSFNNFRMVRTNTSALLSTRSAWSNTSFPSTLIFIVKFVQSSQVSPSVASHLMPNMTSELRMGIGKKCSVMCNSPTWSCKHQHMPLPICVLLLPTNTPKSAVANTFMCSSSISHREMKLWVAPQSIKTTIGLLLIYSISLRVLGSNKPSRALSDNSILDSSSSIS